MGGAVGGLVVLAIIIGLVVYMMKKTTTGNTSNNANSSSTTAVATPVAITVEMKAEPVVVRGKNPMATYSVELTKSPLGLGLSLTDDVVTKVKPDSQAARGGRIKVGYRRLTLTL